MNGKPPKSANKPAAAAKAVTQEGEAVMLNKESNADADLAAPTRHPLGGD